MTVQPAGTTFDGFVTVVKNLADAFFPIGKQSKQKQSGNSILDERPIKDVGISYVVRWVI